jgi:Flp pilus assembly pilin Flp
MSTIQSLIADEQAAAMPEYALLIALIAVTAIAALTALGGSVVDLFDSTGTTLDEEVISSSGS